VLHGRGHPHAEQPDPEHGEGDQQRDGAEHPHRQQYGGQPDRADDEGPAGVGVGEAAAGERPDGGGHAVGEKEGADHRTRHATDLGEERDEVGERRLDRREDQGTGSEHGEHTRRERIPGLADRAPVGRAGDRRQDDGGDGQHQGTDDDHDDERALPSHGLPEQGPERKAHRAGRGEAGNDHGHGSAGPFGWHHRRRGDEGRGDEQPLRRADDDAGRDEQAVVRCEGRQQVGHDEDRGRGEQHGPAVEPGREEGEQRTADRQPQGVRRDEGTGRRDRDIEVGGDEVDHPDDEHLGAAHDERAGEEHREDEVRAGPPGHDEGLLSMTCNSIVAHCGQ
jgi:hypothetical protein